MSSRAAIRQRNKSKYLSTAGSDGGGGDDDDNNGGGGGQSSSTESTWSKAWDVNREWEKKELLDVIYWGRQWVGLILGLIWGVIPLVGFVGIISFCVANVLILLLYYTKYLEIDVEEFDSWDLMKEGFGTSFGMFLVTWICTYSLRL